MKRSKKIGILLGVLLTVCLAIGAVMGIEQKKEEIRVSEEIVLEIPTESVTALAWNSENAPQPLAYHKEENQWIYDEDEAFPVDNAKIEGLLEPFEQFSAAFVIENVEDFAQYGLDDPMGTISITAGETQYEIELGDFSRMDSQRYVSLGDGNVYLAQHDPMDEFDAVLSYTMLHDDIPDFDKIQSVSFAGEESYTAEYLEDSGYSYREEDVYFADAAPLDPTKLETYLRSMSNIILENDVTYQAAQEDLATYGLDQPELTVTVNYLQKNEDDTESEQTVTVGISRDPAEKAKAAESEEENEDTEEEEITAYLRVDESKIIYKISAAEYESMMEYAYNQLRHEEIVPADAESIIAVDITVEDADYQFTSVLDEDDARIWSYQEEPVNFIDLEAALTGLRADEFTEAAPGGKLEASVTITLDDENQTQCTVDLYRHDGERCIAVLNGESLAFIPRSQVVNLIEAVNAIVLG